jgi:hypothetical protein
MFFQTWVSYILILFYFCVQNVTGTFKLQEVFRWSAVDYAYPDEYTRAQAIATQRFVPENNLPVGIEIWNDKLFVTVPRWRVGKKKLQFQINRHRFKILINTRH